MQIGRQSNPGVKVPNPLFNLKNNWEKQKCKKKYQMSWRKHNGTVKTTEMDYLASSHKKSKKVDTIT